MVFSFLGKLLNSRIAVLTLAAFALDEICLSGSVAYFSTVAPTFALRLKWNDAPTLISRAETVLFFQPKTVSAASAVTADTLPQQADVEANTKIKPQDTIESRQSVQRWVETALLAEPLNARALRLFGQLQTSESIEKYMKAAYQRSKHEALATLWLAEKALSQHDPKMALDYFNVFLTTKRNLLPQVAPVLAAMLENVDSSEEVKKFVANNPPWLDTFLAVLPQVSKDVRTPLELYESLQSAKVPVRPAIINQYSRYLFGKKFYDLSYAAWLQLLPDEELAKVKFLFNGDFSFPLSGALFNWNAENVGDASVAIETVTGDVNGNLLKINYGSDRESSLSLFQYVKIPPGKYSFVGQSKSDLSASGLVNWRVRCVPDGPNLLGQSNTLGGTSPEWTKFKFEISVPDQGCELQLVQLFPDPHSHSGSFSGGTFALRNLDVLPLQ